MTSFKLPFLEKFNRRDIIRLRNLIILDSKCYNLIKRAVEAAHPTDYSAQLLKNKIANATLRLEAENGGRRRPLSHFDLLTWLHRFFDIMGIEFSSTVTDHVVRFTNEGRGEQRFKIPFLEKFNRRDLISLHNLIIIDNRCYNIVKAAVVAAHPTNYSAQLLKNEIAAANQIVVTRIGNQRLSSFDLLVYLYEFTDVAMNLNIQEKLRVILHPRFLRRGGTARKCNRREASRKKSKTKNI